MNNNKLLNSPGGMKSYLPSTAREFKEIRNNIEEVIEGWGYEPIITPTLEFYNSLLVGMGQNTKKEFYKMIDYEGNILALRPEMTAPIARTVANRMEGLELPLRLSYFAPVFRYDSPQAGKNREIFQLGLEFIGESKLADVEVIVIAIQALENAGIHNFKIDLGHTGFLSGLIKKLKLNTEEEKKIKNLLNRKDFVSFQEYISKLGPEREELLSEIPRLRGKRQILARAENLVENEKSLGAVNELINLFNHLEKCNMADYINFDLGLIRGLNYYTGIVFEGFTEKLGYTVCGGGRYDNLLARYGKKDIPAVGFALGLERVRLALHKEDHQFFGQDRDVLIIYPPESMTEVLQLSNRLQQNGQIVVRRELKEINEKIIQKSMKQGIKNIVSFIEYPEQKTVEIINTTDGKKKRVGINNLWKNL